MDRRLHLVHHLVVALGDLNHRLTLAFGVESSAEVAVGGAGHRRAVGVCLGFEMFVQAFDLPLFRLDLGFSFLGRFRLG
nr:hypothetical protein [Halobellus inordinatus]